MFARSKHRNSDQNNRAAFATLANKYPGSDIMTNRDFKWQSGASRDNMGHTPSVKKQLNSTPQDALAVSPQLDFTVSDGYPVPSPFLKATKSHKISLQHSTQFESPAKAFAKLKNKVRNEQIRANEGIRSNSDMSPGVRQKGEAAAFNSPRKGNDNKWTIENRITNQWSNLQYDEAEPLTLSFTCSPREGLGRPFSELNGNHLQSPARDVGTFLAPRHGRTPQKNQELDVFPVPRSPRTILARPLQVLRPPAPFRDLGDFEMPNRTPPEQGQSSSLVSTDDDLGRGVSAECGGERSGSSSFMLSPTKMHGHTIEESEWKREPWAVHKVSSGTRKGLRNRVHSYPPQDKPTSTTFDMYTMEEVDTCVDAFGGIAGSGFPVMQSGKTREAVNRQLEIDPGDDVPQPAAKRRLALAENRPLHDSPRTAISKTKAYVSLERLPLLTPSKIFARMKEREKRRQLQEEEKEEEEVYKVSSTTKDLWNRGHSQPQHSKPTFTTFNLDDMDKEDNTCVNACSSLPKSIRPANQSEMSPTRLETVDSQSEIDPCDDVSPPAMKSHPVLIEDPLVINTPQISFPKKREAIFKNRTEPSGSKNNQETKVVGINLKHWRLKCNQGGLYVDGLRSDNLAWWHTNIIAERVSSSVVKTASGSTYVLSGKMNMTATSTLPKWFLKKFLFGFPQRWKEFHKQVLTESKGTAANSQRKERETREWPVSEKAATSSSLKRRVMTSAVCPPVSCPSTSFSAPGSTKQSRSGRVIRPPLDYWRGGRTVLDADNNVTVYTCYETTICKALDTTPVSRRESKKPQKTERVFSHYNDGHRQSEAVISSDEMSAPVRKVRTTHRHRVRAETENPGDQDRSFRSRKSSSPRSPVTEIAPNTDIEYTDSESEPRRTYPKRSRKSFNSDAQKTSEVEESLQSNNSSDQMKRGGRMSSSRGGRRVVEYTDSESEPRRTYPKRSQKPSSSDAKRPGRMSRADKPMKSPPPKPTQSNAKSSKRNGKVNPKTVVPQEEDEDEEEWTERELVRLQETQSKAKSSKRNGKVNPKTVVPQEEDEDEEEWTERELARLQEAVTSCPKHMGSFWMKVAAMVQTRSDGECQKQYTSHETFPAPVKKTKKKQAPNKEAESPKITAGAGTLKIKRQVRQVLATIPKGDHDDIFSSTPMQKMRFQHPSTEAPSEKEHSFMNSVENPLSPGLAGFAIVKTPQNLHITPGMMGSVNRNMDDKMIFQLQKRMKKSQAAVHRHTSAPKNFSPTPPVKRTMRRCSDAENDAFVIWKMFPDNDEPSHESGEEEDYYFTDD